MKNDIKIRFADITIGVSSKSDFMRRFCKDYLSDGEPLFSVSVSEDMVDEELKNAEEPTTREYAEALCIYREIAEKLPLYDCVVFHGAAVEYEGKAYIFTAPSGTGKTTHICLWKKYIGNSVKIINGDKPIISLSKGTAFVYGTSYAGKEGLQTNSSAPLAGICFLSQGHENIMNEVKPGDAFTKLYLQTYKPYAKEAMEKTMAIVRSLCEIPCYSLSCDISESAVMASFETLTHGKFTEKKR